MRNSENGREPRPDQSLVVPAQVAAPQQVPYRPTQAGSTAAGLRQNLADEAREQRSQQRARALLIRADHRLRDRFVTPTAVGAPRSKSSRTRLSSALRSRRTEGEGRGSTIACRGGCTGYPSSSSCSTSACCSTSSRESRT